MLGDGITFGALPLLAASISTDPRLVSLVSVAAQSGWLLLGLVSGVLVDRWRRTQVMWVVDALRFVVAGCFGGLGDVRIVPKLQLLDDRESVGLALVAEVRAPTHTGDFSGGARMLQFIPKAVLDHRFLSGVRVGLNAGVAIRENTQFANVVAGDEFAYAVAIGYRFGGLDGNTELGVELNGGVGLSQSDQEELPLEGFLFLRHNPSEEWEIIGGPGIGLIAGYGVPTFRGFVGVRFTPTANDRDHDGVPDDEDKCPDIPEDRDRDRDTDGCPEEDEDSDRDGVPDRDDECPTAKETINGHRDDDGCPDSGDPRVIYEDGKFKILDAVHFEHGKSDIKQESHSLLDQVALTIKANPDVNVRVEGHTDDTGPRDVNVRLSKARAESVRRYLVNKGVSPARLRAQGYGPDKPLVEKTTDEARAKNRPRRIRRGVRPGIGLLVPSLRSPERSSIIVEWAAVGSGC